MSDLTFGLPTKRQFIEQVDNVFVSRLPDGRSFELTLSTVEEHASSDTHENFSLIFSGPVSMPREQAVYSLENETIEAFDIFLVPVGLDADRLQLEAVFNHVPLPSTDRI